MDSAWKVISCNHITIILSISIWIEKTYETILSPTARNFWTIGYKQMILHNFNCFKFISCLCNSCWFDTGKNDESEVLPSLSLHPLPVCLTVCTTAPLPLRQWRIYNYLQLIPNNLRNWLLFLINGTLTHDGISQSTSHGRCHGNDDFKNSSPKVLFHGFSVFTVRNKNKDKPQ